jgi:hypothetical protein
MTEVPPGYATPSSETRQVVKKHATVATPEGSLVEVLQSLPTLLGEEQKTLLSDALLSLTRLSLSAKTFLTLSEAAWLLGLSEERVKALANQGAIPAAKGKGKSGRWTFCRSDLSACNLSTLTHLSGMSLMTPTVDDTIQNDTINGHASH